MLKKLLWTVLGIIIAVPLVGGLAGVKVKQFQDMMAAAEEMEIPPEVVNVAEVEQQTWQPRVSSVGSVVAVQGTEISTEVEGIVREIQFEAGSAVKAGDLLVQLDIDVERAELRAAEASAELALVNYRRAKELVASSNISKEEFDTAAGTLKEASARVENLRAVIAKKSIRAPFAGKLGIKEISIGQFLQKGNPVVSLQALDPVYVEFSLPQQQLAQVKEGLEASVTTDAYEDQKFTGKVTAINPGIDVVTRNVKVQATLPNKDSRLRPGMFVSVDVLMPETTSVLVIPATAVLPAPYGDSVFIIRQAATSEDETSPTLVAQQEFVKLGNRQGDFVAVNEGLELGEQVVSTGAFKLAPGTTVTIDNSLAPEFELNPKPNNT